MSRNPTTLNSPQIKRGGPRPGAGRKPSELTLAFRNFFEPDLKPLLQALRDVALGHQRRDSKGRVYEVAPDRAAICYILDRLIGRPRPESEDGPNLDKLLEHLRGDDATGA